MKYIHSFTILTTMLLIFSSMTVQSQSRITGSVMDSETQELIPGVNIIVVGSNTGATTDFDGNFILNTSASPPFTLEVSSIGFSTQQIEVVFVPLLTFDRQGHRVGYGKGYYDRFLAQCYNSTLRIGLSFFDPVTKIEDVDAHDIALDFAITPREVYTF